MKLLEAFSTSIKLVDKQKNSSIEELVTEVVVLDGEGDNLLGKSTAKSLEVLKTGPLVVNSGGRRGSKKIQGCFRRNRQSPKFPVGNPY